MDQWSHIDVPRKEVELASVLTCGQSFRWKNYGEESSDWIGVFAHRLWVLRQTDDRILFKVYGSPTILPDEYEHLLREYFQLDISLPELYRQWSEKDPKFASLTAVDYQGIRILKQNPIENTFCFICSSNNNISRISQMVEKMCINYGEKIAELDGKWYYDFPKVEALCGEDVEKLLRKESFGYRAGFIANSAVKIVENGGDKWIENLTSIGYNEARKELQTLPGVGRKVADCICLMSLGYPQAIPVDTHIHQVAKEYLPHIAKVKTLTEKVYAEIVEYFQSIYGDYAGWAHSVLFASTLRHIKTQSSNDSKQNVQKPKSQKLNKQIKNKEELETCVMKTKSTIPISSNKSSANRPNRNSTREKRLSSETVNSRSTSVNKRSKYNNNNV